MKSRLSLAHYDVVLTDTLSNARELCAERTPDLIFVDISLGTDAIQMMSDILTDQPNGQEVPIVATAPTKTPGLLAMVLALGADDLMVWPIGADRMRARIRCLTRRASRLRSLRQRGLGVGSIQIEQRALRNRFAIRTPGIIVARTREKALEWAQKLAPHAEIPIAAQSYATALDPVRAHSSASTYLIVTDPTNTDDSLQILNGLKTRGDLQDASYLVLTDAADVNHAAIALDMGAGDVIELTETPEDIALRLRQLSDYQDQVNHLNGILEDGLRMAITDALTGLHNRRYAEYRLTLMTQEARVHGSTFCLMLLDIDHFKSVNDRFGHVMGDMVLTQISQILNRNLRNEDLLARIGGEEFLIAIPGSSAQHAMATANRLREAVEAQVFSPGDNKHEFQVTLSVGVAVADGTLVAQDVIEQADRALYSAKEQGRNRACLMRRLAA